MRFLPLALTLALSGASLLADESPAGADAERLPGHSAHGEAFDQGPRRQAVLLSPEAVGDIHFPITAASAETQAFFNQGVGQLHGFWYYEAERSFRQAALLDPQCAMAYWGLAMANTNNPKRAAEFIKTAGKLKEKASPREQGWIHALADYYADANTERKGARGQLVKALEKLSYDFPDDIEIKAFLMLQIWDNEMHGLPVGSHQAVAALAQEVLARQPMHPVHHYLIHLWNGIDDRRALSDAARCGQSAPGIAHMWHMSGHTFTALHRYADAAWQQEASARVDHEDIMRWRILPEEIHNYAHNNDWLIEDLSYVGRVRDGIDLARNMVELPRLAPESEIVGKERYSEEGAGYLHGERRLLQILPGFELWDELCALEDTLYLAPFDKPEEETRRLATLGIAWYLKGDAARGDEKRKQVRLRLTQAREARYADGDAAERTAKQDHKPADQVAKAMAEAMQKHTRDIEETEKALAEVDVYRALGRGDFDAARKALPEAKTLPKEWLVPIQERLGDHAAAEETARELVRSGPGRLLPQALLADALWSEGKKPEALEAFQQLRGLSAQADLDLPIFRRLAPLAAEAKQPADWRPELQWPADSGVRPQLSSLGPFRWQPYAAPDWQLTDSSGQTRTLAQYKGKPLLVIFYLGHGCTHCVEQLNIFGPETKAYAEAGISMVALSSDAADELPKTFALLKQPEQFPFPIVADPALDVFKAYHCFDEFENTALHGTFLIDGQGLVRWQNISAEPFRNPQWLAGEAKRLLALPAAAPQVAAAAAAR
jgi:peroxiredoxin